MNPAEIVNSADNRGEFEGFTSLGTAGEPGNGPYCKIWIREAGGVIQRCHYATHGCMWSVACAGALARLATGRTTGKARLIEPRDIDLLLGGIPDGKGHCADMAVSALGKALGAEE